MRVSGFKKNVRTIQVETIGGEVKVTYTPDAYTPRFEKVLADDAGQEAQTRTLARMVSQLVTDWDLKDDRGAPEAAVETLPVYPLDYESLCDLPAMFLGDICREITGDMAPKAGSSTSSGSFS